MEPRRGQKAHLIRPVIMLAFVVFAGGTALFVLGRGRWTFWESIYNAFIAGSTVGFAEPAAIQEIPHARGVLVAIIFASLGVVAYFQSNLTTFLVEDVLAERFRTRRMMKQIAHVKNHVIVAGAGSTGRHVIRELISTKTPFVVVDTDKASLEALSDELQAGKMLFVTGDATADPTLVAAGIERAEGVVAALTEDRDNLYVTLSARNLNPSARIVTKVIQPDAAKKMMRAGATSTVSPNMIGGLRMAHELLRPTAIQFIDRMMNAKGAVLRIEEVVIPDGSWFAGRELKELPIRSETKLLVVAAYEGDAFHYNPSPSFVLKAGMVLVVMGELDNIERLRDMVPLTSPTESYRT